MTGHRVVVYGRFNDLRKEGDIMRVFDLAIIVFCCTAIGCVCRAATASKSKSDSLDLPSLGRGDLSHRRTLNLDTFLFGAPYYPGHWDAAARENDAELMAAAGFNVVRMAEFSWDRMEPTEGRFDFSLYDEVIATLGAKGIKTILCTPTATPPRWLTLRHPEIVRVDENGVAQVHGSRQHACHASEVFRRHSRIITQAMADHFRDNPNVIGWQTDNEFNCHFSECHCESCQRAFAHFLRKKYGTVQELNRRWGTAFWSQTYLQFRDILTPRAKPTYINPAHALDYYRFISHTVAVFQHEQVEILRRANPKWFVMHNGIFRHIDYRGEFSRDLDFLSFDSYPFFDYSPANRHRSHAFRLDAVRALTGNFMIPEQQSGPGGQGNYFHDNPEPGELRLMTYRSIAHGADSLLYFRWRACRFGAEEYWCGILDHDNIPRRRYREVKQVGAELRRVGPAVLGTSVRVDVAVATGDFSVEDGHIPLTLGLPSPEGVAREIHAVLLTHGYAVGCIHPEDVLKGVKLYLIPHWSLFKSEWVPKLEKYVRDGGVLVIGARTGTKDFDNNMVAETPPGCLAELTGVKVVEYSKINRPEERPINITIGESSVPAPLWYEVLEPAPDAEVIGRWADRFGTVGDGGQVVLGGLTGRAAITSRKVGKGRVIYAGTYLMPEVVEALLPMLKGWSGLQPLCPDAPSKAEVVIRENDEKQLWFFLNHSDEELTVSPAPLGEDLITGKRCSGRLVLPRNGVAVIRK
ncbi:beta-galactosidase [bacterium]|nr:beta-galactosidase [bacterium]